MHTHTQTLHTWDMHTIYFSYTHTYIHTYIHTVHTYQGEQCCKYTYIHTYPLIKVCIHTYIHTYIRIIFCASVFQVPGSNMEYRPVLLCEHGQVRVLHHIAVLPPRRKLSGSGYGIQGTELKTI